ncbi:MAG: PPE domain-containing protein [Mycobacterium sp.]|uniref:PPE domain-containing protein n=1 Tax=Mycobacterium sp. TaxID=1785 RepID=UPI0026096EAA|nr:PPE domain-containing protein [Mycobacterium sp.]MDI3313209.1 PPE domain-containing protein [Mycobacterium sp.]
MPDPLWFGPPESVAALLEASDPSTVIAHIAAWLSEAVSHELSMGMSMANIAATMSQWIGLGGVASALKGSELNFAGLAPMVAHCLKHVTIGQAAVEANTIARSSVIPAAVCQANRDETAALHATNFCGCNTPAIIANDTQYFGNFWPQNMSAGLMYAGTLNTLMGAIASTPPPITPLGASPAAAAAPAESVVESAAGNAGGLPSLPAEAAQTAGSTASPMDAMSQLLQPVQQAVSSVPQLASSVGQGPTQLIQGASQSLSSPMQSLMGMFPGLMSQSGASTVVEPVAAAAEPIAGSGAGAVGLGSGAAGGAGGVAYPGAGLTSFTRPASTFEPEGGRPIGLRPGGMLNAADLRGPTTTSAGGAAMPVSPAAAGMLGRENSETDKDKVTHARIVVDHGRKDSP